MFFHDLIVSLWIRSEANTNLLTKGKGRRCSRKTKRILRVFTVIRTVSLL